MENSKAASTNAENGETTQRFSKQSKRPEEMIYSLGELAILFGEEVSAERLTLTYRALSDIHERDLLDAITVWAKYGHRFPTPAQLRDAAKGIIPGQPRRIRNRENWQ